MPGRAGFEGEAEPLRVANLAVDRAEHWGVVPGQREADRGQLGAVGAQRGHRLGVDVDHPLLPDSCPGDLSSAAELRITHLTDCPIGRCAH